MVLEDLGLYARLASVDPSPENESLFKIVLSWNVATGYQPSVERFNDVIIWLVSLGNF